MRCQMVAHATVITGHVAQRQEATGLGPEQCGFESHRAHYE